MNALRALIVDHRAGRGSVLAGALHADGWTTRVAPAGRTAIRWAPRFRPDVVALAPGLPGLDGLAVVRALRARGVEARFLLVLSPLEIVDGLAAEAACLGDDVLVAPCSTAEVYGRLRCLAGESPSTPGAA